MEKKYTIGEYSQKFLDALDALQNAENQFFDALTANYGEERGEEYYQKHVDQFEAVERTIMEYLRILFTQGMGTNNQALTL